MWKSAYVGVYQLSNKSYLGIKKSIYIPDFKLSPCTECCMLSSG